jgi:hypothetical protein
MPFYTRSVKEMPKKTPAVAPVSEKPLPGSPEGSVTEPKRPGTSGTELLLTTNRRTASEQYAAAQRAEAAYKAKKRSAGARQHRIEAKDHLKQGTWHLKEFVKSSVKMVAAVPWMLRGWREGRQDRNEEKAVARFEKKRAKMEEAIKKREAMKGKEEKDAEADVE